MKTLIEDASSDAAQLIDPHRLLKVSADKVA
jgi:hypothetical protein